MRMTKTMEYLLLHSCLPVDPSVTFLSIHSWKFLFCRVYPVYSSIPKAVKECSSVEMQARSHLLVGSVIGGKRVETASFWVVAQLRSRY